MSCCKTLNEFLLATEVSFSDDCRAWLQCLLKKIIIWNNFYFSNFLNNCIWFYHYPLGIESLVFLSPCSVEFQLGECAFNKDIGGLFPQDLLYH